MDNKTVTVVGLGKIGLPLAVQFALKGMRVFGVDKNAEIVDSVNNSVEPYPGEEDLSFNLERVIRNGRLFATIDLEKSVSQSEFVVVVVPLYTNKENEPDYINIDEVSEKIGNSMQPGVLISFETTLPIGTTRNRVLPILEQQSRMKIGKDFNLVFSPERVLTGRVFNNLKKYPKLVGGITPGCTKAGVMFYESVLDFDHRDDLPKANGVWEMPNCETAEFTKLAETTYRDVNIALANQFALFAQELNLDFFNIIQAANSQPFSHIHRPGIAVGGHCIPVYPKLYLSTDNKATLVKEAREVNEAMPQKLVEAIERVHGSCFGQRVAIFGLSYRGGVKESAYSGAFSLLRILSSKGAIISLNDPLYSDLEIRNHGFKPYHLGEPVDIIIIQADHKEFVELNPSQFPEVRTVVDGRGILEVSDWPKLNFVSLEHESSKFN